MDIVFQKAARYEYLRRLNPQQFQALWETNLKTGRHFDELVDEAIAEEQAAKQMVSQQG